ncbi:MAG: class I SAM-dependent methyltransferase [Polyangiaceae bacterium]|jgi:cyclopropane fatty-acyl-phospholipid synthase-like methyltransferase|nr:class I SAM-dependent methyltransferase [Polyangiaceae bacterium]
MIDRDKVKAFWDARADTYRSLKFESIANLEQDPQNLELKIRLESEKVFAYLETVAGKTVLDLGAGVGQWAFRFVDRGAADVTAVEYSARLARIGAREAERRGVSNLRFIVSPAEDVSLDGQFDIVFISGLFVYMNDDQAEKLTPRLATLCHSDTRVVVRDGTGLRERFEIDDRPSEHLGTSYSATYRTAAQYQAMFERSGFELLRHENMFDERCPLNKFAETRLRIYEFGRRREVRDA